MKRKIILVAVVVLVLLGAFVVIDKTQGPKVANANGLSVSSNEFSTDINNKYYSLPAGREFTYISHSKDGVEKNVILVTDKTKAIEGVTTRVVSDKAWLNGELIEDTQDYLAQDKQGNVWYFGENVNNYEKGKLKDHSGSWIAGVDNAQAGYWVKANPVLGETYKQEYYKGQAEDQATVKSLDKSVKVGDKTYQHCLHTHDFTPVDTKSIEEKYYCPEVANVVLEDDIGEGIKIPLTDIKDSVPTPASFSVK